VLAAGRTLKALCTGAWLRRAHAEGAALALGGAGRTLKARRWRLAVAARRTLKARGLGVPTTTASA
jgi:hypothetical protein